MNENWLPVFSKGTGTGYQFFWKEQELVTRFSEKNGNWLPIFSKETGTGYQFIWKEQELVTRIFEKNGNWLPVPFERNRN